MQQPACPNIAAVLARIPSGLFVLTSCHDDTRTGVLVEWVQQCSTEPPMVVVALRKGHPIEPLIRDSRFFGLCQLELADTLLRRKFEGVPDHGEDLFISLGTTTGPFGSPVLTRARAWLECELTRHFDLECDFEVYVGLVRAGEVHIDEREAESTSPEPAVSEPAGAADISAKGRKNGASPDAGAERSAASRLRSRRHSA